MFGGKNPFPSFRLGGGRSRVDRIHRALRKAMGENGPGPEGGLEDLWTLCEARVMALAEGTLRQAFYQAFAQTMGSFGVARWERLLQIPQQRHLVDRQEAVRLAITSEPDATIPGLRASLKRIDPAFEVVSVPWEKMTTVQFGKAFGPLPGVAGQPFRTGAAVAIFQHSTAWPAYSDAYVTQVQYVLSAGQLNIPLSVLAQAEELLNEVLPFYQDWSIFALADGPDGAGWYLDGGPDNTSFLDQTAFT